MEFLILLIAFVALGIAAARWGRDSRDSLHSAEHDLADRGVTWSGRPLRPAASPQPSRRV
jgi:hypothetical protein